MKRLLVLTLLVVTTSSASPRRVVHIPTIGELCPGGEDWDKVTTCIKRQAPAAKIIRDQPDLKLVRVAENTRFGGLYLYTHPKQWKLSGEVRTYQDFDLLSFEPGTFGKRSGYRIDIGMAQESAITFDPESGVVVPALFVYKLTSLCLGEGYGCVQMTTSCDVLVHGKAYNSFRGKLVYENKQLKVVGDRSNAGQYCTQGELVMQD